MIEELAQVISDVILMGGDTVSEMLAPSEIREIARSVAASGLMPGTAALANFPAHLAWMGNIPPHLHDCFNGQRVIAVPAVQPTDSMGSGVVSLSTGGGPTPTGAPSK